MTSETRVVKSLNTMVPHIMRRFGPAPFALTMAR